MIDFSKQLAREIGRAIDSAAQHRGDGISLYPYIVGHLMGHCTSEDIAALEERLERLTGHEAAAFAPDASETRART